MDHISRMIDYGMREITGKDDDFIALNAMMVALRHNVLYLTPMSCPLRDSSNTPLACARGEATTKMESSYRISLWLSLATIIMGLAKVNKVSSLYVCMFGLSCFSSCMVLPFASVISFHYIRTIHSMSRHHVAVSLLVAD